MNQLRKKLVKAVSLRLHFEETVQRGRIRILSIQEGFMDEDLTIFLCLVGQGHGIQLPCVPLSQNIFWAFAACVTILLNHDVTAKDEFHGQPAFAAAIAALARRAQLVFLWSVQL